MFREQLPEALKAALKEKDEIAVSTLRLIMAALKDRDIAARSKGNDGGIGEDEILQMLQTMVKQRRESISMYEKGGRQELADQEGEEIKIIEQFLPDQLSDAEIEAAVDKVIAETGAAGLKDMGGVMGALREGYAGQMDFGKASAIVKARLAG
ncbi:MAG: glutamyl-tRNA amidotransferase [Alphaproteobacteria bacterium]|nr:glutamyl-tRNA amidotransferase [Alphaproteobacteria bacterium]|tara:strand:- start:1171 stop:1629 length:459 start_codon:yes stop_codon:yes gene_type:complete